MAVETLDRKRARLEKRSAGRSGPAAGGSGAGKAEGGAGGRRGAKKGEEGEAGEASASTGAEAEAAGAAGRKRGAAAAPAAAAPAPPKAAKKAPAAAAAAAAGAGGAKKKAAPAAAKASSPAGSGDAPKKRAVSGYQAFARAVRDELAADGSKRRERTHGPRHRPTALRSHAFLVVHFVLRLKCCCSFTAISFASLSSACWFCTRRHLRRCVYAEAQSDEFFFAIFSLRVCVSRARHRTLGEISTIIAGRWRELPPAEQARWGAVAGSAAAGGGTAS